MAAVTSEARVETGEIATHRFAGGAATDGFRFALLRLAAGVMVAAVLLFLLNNYLVYWHDWPGPLFFFAHQGWFGLVPPATPLDDQVIGRGWMQCVLYALTLAAVVVYILITPQRLLRADSELLSALAASVVRAAFWSVLLVGLADMIISFLRVEGLLAQIVGEELTRGLGRSQFRGSYVHLPLIAVSIVIAVFVRALGVTWLALLVVFAEFQIVISRFVFSYEQAFMGDLVRFWYAAMFLFASAYALIEEGHVRVDVLYTHFSERGKAWANALGSVFLGLPLCWVILITGMSGKGSSINGPLLSFEISQSGYGMYVKYLMAAFLVVFAVSMAIQFVSYLLMAASTLRNEPKNLVHSATVQGSV